MTDKRDTELGTITGPLIADGDLWPVVDVSDTSMAISGTDKTLTTVQAAVALGTRLAARIVAVADVNYTIVQGDEMIEYTNLTAARSILAITAAAFGAGRRLFISDQSGNASPTLALTLQRAAADTISGSTSYAAVTTPYGTRGFMSDGVSRWIVLG